MQTLQRMGAAVLLFAAACENAPEPFSPTYEPMLVAGGKSENQSASGHVVILIEGVVGFAEYTFTAAAKKGAFSGHVSARFVDAENDFFLEGDVSCLNVTPGLEEEPGSVHARITAKTTSTNIPLLTPGTEFGWTVTDRGESSKLEPDGGSTMLIGDPDFCTSGNVGEQRSDRNKIKARL
jgi:hypothetical protein